MSNSLLTEKLKEEMEKQQEKEDTQFDLFEAGRKDGDVGKGEA